MDNWRNVWRQGFAPALSTAGLQALRGALRLNDPRLVQGATTTPPPLLCVQDWPVEACCALGFCGWQGDGLHTVGEVEEHFAQACFEADRRLGEPAACRWFLNWFDDAPRAEMRRELLVEVELELRNREASTEFEFDFDSASERLPVNRLRDYPWPVEEPDDANVEIEAIREAVLN